MISPAIILKYFTQLSPKQQSQFEMLGHLYPEWNEKINVISRKDIDNLYEHHILHSLAICKFITPIAGTRFLDMGTGGGFPGIPLAIMWPQCQFHLIDRIGKKIKVAKAIAEAIGLENVTFQHGDIGECLDKYDFVVSRAVMRLSDLHQIPTLSPMGCYALRVAISAASCPKSNSLLLKCRSAIISLRNSSKRKNLFTLKFKLITVV